MNLLLLGPCQGKNKDITGGIIVLFHNLIKELKIRNIDNIVVNTNLVDYPNKFVGFLNVLVSFIKNIKKCTHISLHGTAKDFLYIAPIVVLFAKLFNKKVSLRKFAGNFNIYYLEANIFKRLIYNYILKSSDVNFFETKYLVNFFKKLNKNTFWLPNSRQKIDSIKIPNFSRKFIFIGHIKKEKGVEDIFNSLNYLPDNIIIDLYGEITEEKYKNESYWKNKVISYKGIIPFNKVQIILQKYDVLILPSYLEGYPGVIIEAFSVGLPVIATNLDGIKEIVEDEVTGFLINPNAPKEIASAILKFNKENYIQFSKNALENFKNFDSNLITEKFLLKISC